jgi:rifampin ADP-ribosylating transferase
MWLNTVFRAWTWKKKAAPLKIVGEVTEWARQTPANLQKFREKLENNKGEIIN